MICKCGFKFSGPGEFRNCDAFITQDGESGFVCPDCGQAYIGTNEVKLVSDENQSNEI